MELSPISAEVLESQLKGLTLGPRTQSGAVATLLLLLPRMDEGLAHLITPTHIETLTSLLDGKYAFDAPEDPSIQVKL